MDGRVVHEGFILGGKLGAEIEAVADGRGAVFEERVTIAVPILPPPLVISAQGLIEPLEEGARPRAQVDHPHDERHERRLGAVDPGIVAGEKAGEIPRIRLAGQNAFEIFPGLVLAELGLEKSVDGGVGEPDAEAAEFPDVPVAAACRVGPGIDRIPDGVPCHDVPDRGEGAAVPHLRRPSVARLSGDAGGGLARTGDRHGECVVRHLLKIEAQGDEPALGGP